MIFKKSLKTILLSLISLTLIMRLTQCGGKTKYEKLKDNDVNRKGSRSTLPNLGKLFRISNYALMNNEDEIDESKNAQSSKLWYKKHTGTGKNDKEKEINKEKDKDKKEPT